MAAPDTTPNRGYPRPDPDHSAKADAARIAQTIDMVDGDVATVLKAIDELEIITLALGN